MPARVKWETPRLAGGVDVSIQVKVSVGQQLPGPGPQGISHVPEPPISPGVFCRCSRKMRSSEPGIADRCRCIGTPGILAASSWTATKYTRGREKWVATGAGAAALPLCVWRKRVGSPRCRAIPPIALRPVSSVCH